MRSELAIEFPHPTIRDGCRVEYILRRENAEVSV